MTQIALNDTIRKKYWGQVTFISNITPSSEFYLQHFKTPI